MVRKYLPSLAELLDRLTIIQLKEVMIPEHRQEYTQEIQDILFDINNIILEDNIVLTADLLRIVIVPAQFNLHIWHNEASVRAGTSGNDKLRLTHSINGIRNLAKNKISELVGGRMDYKRDCLAEEFSQWTPSI